LGEPSEPAPSTLRGSPKTDQAEGAATASRRGVLALRVLLLALSGCALVAAVVASLGDRGARGAHVKYVCPMHPEVTSAEPGVCPICRMELEAINANTSAEASSAVRSSTYQSYDIARSRAYGPNTPAPAWVAEDGTVVAMLYADEMAPGGAQQRGAFISPSTPAAGVELHSTSDAPEPWDRSTSRVHFEVDPAGPALRAGDVGWLKLAVRQREAPVVPSAAVLEGADGPYVLVASANGRILARRPVRIGREFGGMAAVLSGLRASERVLIRGAFFVDAERRLRREATIEIAPR